jgi:hypothetical protein
VEFYAELAEASLGKLLAKTFIRHCCVFRQLPITELWPGRLNPFREAIRIVLQAAAVEIPMVPGPCCGTESRLMLKSELTCFEHAGRTRVRIGHIA